MPAGESGSQRPEGALVCFITATNDAEAGAIARALVSERLAACVNTLGVRSTYRWKGKVESGEEVLLIAKTARPRFEDLRARVRSLSSYDVPEIIAVGAAEADADYLAWLLAETDGR